MKEKSRGIHYAWIVMAMCCLSTGASLGIANNCMGLFYPSVSSEFGCGYAQISLSTTLTSIFSCVFLLLVSKRICLKYPLRFVLLAASLCYVPKLLLSFSSAIWQWWVCALFSGMAASFLNGFASSILLERWFKKKLAIALSIVGCFSGIFGTAASYVLGRMITSMGWRKANLYGCIVLILLTSLPNLFLALDPREMGKTAFGAEEDVCSTSESVEEPITATKPRFDAKMMSMLGLSIGFAVFSTFVFHLNSYATVKGFVAYDVSLLTTMFMLGNLLFKAAFGVAVEKMGLRRSTLGVYWFTMAGVVLLALGRPYMALAGSLLLGGSSVLAITTFPLISRSLYDSSQYPTVVQRYTVTMSVSCALLGFVYGWIVDALGSYFVVFIAMAIAVAGSIVITMRVLKK